MCHEFYGVSDLFLTSADFGIFLFLFYFFFFFFFFVTLGLIAIILLYLAHLSGFMAISSTFVWLYGVFIQEI